MRANWWYSLSPQNLPIKLAHLLTANQENTAQMLIYMVRCDGLFNFFLSEGSRTEKLAWVEIFTCRFLAPPLTVYYV